MTTLSAHFGPHAGEMRIFVGIFDVGNGSFDSFGEFDAKFGGAYDFLGQSGTFNIGVKLGDTNPASPSGPCELTLNDKTDNAATYQVNADKLVVTTTLNDAPVNVYPHQGGTQIDGISGHSFWIGP